MKKPLTLRERNMEVLIHDLLDALKFCRSVIANLPPCELSEMMAIDKADAVIKRAALPETFSQPSAAVGQPKGKR